MKLLDELIAITQLFDENGIDYALCGGLAMAVYNMARTTIDIDLVIEPDALEKALDSLVTIGYVLHALPMKLNNDSVHIHRITKIDSADHASMSLDLLLVTPAIQPFWETRQRLAWRGKTLSVLSPQGMIGLKSIRSSARDLEDIEYLRETFNEH